MIAKFSRQFRLCPKESRIFISMNRFTLLGCLLVVSGAVALAQQSSAPSPPPDRSREAQESSSHDTRGDISPPKDDAKNHPASKEAVEDLVPEEGIEVSGVQEFHPWNPMKALKDIEVGDFYFKHKNYKAALDRYKEALYYKDNDAVATFRLAVCQERLGEKAEARKNYEQYLKILPDGPFAKDAHAALDKLPKNVEAKAQAAQD